MIFPLLFLLPLAAAVTLFLIGKAHWHNRRVRWIVWGSLATALGAGVLNLWAIFHSTSSTAAIGIVFIPLTMALATPPGALLGIMAHEAVHRPAGLTGIVSITGFAAFAIAAGFHAHHILQFRQMQSHSDPRQLARAAREKLEQRDYFVLAAIAANTNTSPETLLAIATHPDSGLHQKRTAWINSYDRDQLAVVRKVIRHPHVPVEALVKLSDSKNEYVLGDIAQQPRTPVEILERLGATPHGYLVDWGLAVNPATPVSLLQSLPYGTDKTIAQFLARNTSTPAPILEKLAAHPDAIVRGNVAGNRAAPPEVLRRLSTDTENWVARQAQWQLGQPR